MATVLSPLLFARNLHEGDETLSRASLRSTSLMWPTRLFLSDFFVTHPVFLMPCTLTLSTLFRATPRPLRTCRSGTLSTSIERIVSFSLGLFFFTVAAFDDSFSNFFKILLSHFG